MSSHSFHRIDYIGVYLKGVRECPEEWSALGDEHQPIRMKAQTPKPYGILIKVPAVAFRSSFPPPPDQGPLPHFHTSSPACNTNTNMERGAL